MSPARSLALLAALLLSACSDDRVLTTDASAGSTTEPASTTAPTPPTTGGDSSTGEPAACSCSTFAPDAGCGDDELFTPVAACPATAICPTLTARCPHPSDLYDCQADIVFDEPALACILTAMRDRTPGSFVVEGIDDGGIFSSATVWGVRLLGGDAVVYTRCQSTDTGHFWGAARATLAPPARFTECLAEPSPAARHACVLDGMRERVELPTCGE